MLIVGLSFAALIASPIEEVPAVPSLVAASAASDEVQTDKLWSDDQPAAGTARGADEIEAPDDPQAGVSCPDNAPLYCQTGNYCCPNNLPYCCGNMLCGETSAACGGGGSSCDSGQVDCGDWCCAGGSVCGSAGSDSCCPSDAPYHCASEGTCSADPNACGGGGGDSGGGGGNCNPGDTTCSDGCCPAGSVCGTPGTNKCCPADTPYHCAATSTCSADPNACDGGGGGGNCDPGQTACSDGCCAAGSVCGTPGTNTCCPEDAPYHCPETATCSASSTACSDSGGSGSPGSDPAGYTCAVSDIPGADCSYIRFCISEADSCDGFYEADGVSFDCNACSTSDLQSCANEVVDYCVDVGGGGGGGGSAGASGDDGGDGGSGGNRRRRRGCSSSPDAPVLPSLLFLGILGLVARRRS